MVTIRDYAYKDLDATIKLMKILSKTLSIEFDEANWKPKAKLRSFNPEFRTLIAEYREKVVGMCFADIERDETGQFHGLIRNIIVDPQFRSRGVATQLITTAIDIFIELGINSIQVQVSEQIKDVIPLFQKFAFKRASIIMEKDVVKIRGYNEKDYEDTKELMQIYSKLTKVPFNEAEWKHTIRIVMRNPQFHILISESEGKVTGMAIVKVASDETGLTIGYLENVIVHPKYRRQGFGKTLLIRAIEILHVLNVDKIRIMAHLEVKKYLKVFEDVGFHKAAYIMEYKRSSN